MLLRLHQRCQYGSFYRPSTINTILKRTYVHAYVCGPLGHCFADAIVLKYTVVPLVVGLDSLRRPSTVAWRVPFVCIYAINTMFWRRFFSHIREKQRKVVPPGANSNASSSVVLETGCVTIGAPVTHIKPSVIERMLAKSVRSEPGYSIVTSEASAGYRLTASQRTCEHTFFSPAFAPTEEGDLLRFSISSENSPSSEGSANEPVVGFISNRTPTAFRLPVFKYRCIYRLLIAARTAAKPFCRANRMVFYHRPSVKFLTRKVFTFWHNSILRRYISDKIGERKPGRKPGFQPLSLCTQQ